MTVSWEIHYDRRVSAEFLDHFRPGHELNLLVEIAQHAPYPVDLQFRRDAKTRREHASLYIGLTDVLKADVASSGQVRLTAHPTWTDTDGKDEHFGFRKHWKSSVAGSEWSAVEDYLERVIPVATAKHAAREGSVQAAVSTFSSADHVVIDREAVLHFRDTATKTRIMAEIAAPILDALADLSGVEGKPKTSFGGECDLLALDRNGEVMAIEIKPRNVGSIRWAAAQATMYAKLFERWLRSTDTPAQPVDVLRGEWHQRSEIGLCDPVDSRLPDGPSVRPVVVVQRGTRDDLLDECRLVQARLCEAQAGYAGLTVWETGMTGRLKQLAI